MIGRRLGVPKTPFRAQRAATALVAVVVALVAGIGAQIASGSPRSERPAALAPPPIPNGYVPAGAVPSGQQVSIQVILAPRDPSGLHALLSNLYDPSSPQYHQWLAPGAFVARFGPSSSTVAATVGWLSGLGLHASARAGFTVEATGSAASVSSAFGISFERYRSTQAGSVFATTRTPVVPSSLAPEITDIVGLNDVPAATPMAREMPSGQIANGSATAGPIAPGASVLPAAQQVCSSAASLATGNGGFTPATLGAAYGVPALTSAGFNGSGEHLAVYELAPSSASDVSTFQSCFGLKVPVNVVSVDGGGTPDSGGTGEADLDIEQLASQAPGAAQITSYEGPNSGIGQYDTAARIVNDDAAKFISDSWGICESLTPTSGSGTIASVDVLLEQAASQGQSIFTAAGDSGSEDCFVDTGDTSLAVDYPSSSPWVTAVGGTSLSLNGSETVWNGCDGVVNSGCGNGDGAGSGGTSSIEAKPLWQLGLHSPPSALCAPSGSSCREVPDVSADAGVPVAFYTGGAWGLFIGTSIGAPLDAGIWADRGSECGQPTSGTAAPYLYEIALTGGYGGAINDITSGSNDLSGTNGGLFTAGVGYDLASGLGSLNAGGVACTAVQSVLPSQAPAGSQVTVHGFGLQNATIAFGGVRAQVISATATTALVVAPPGSGAVSVTATGPVANAGGEGSFTYGSPVGVFTRVFGTTAIGTAIASSQVSFPAPGSAKAVVLARDDFFSDALAGGPLAAAQGGPVLITESAARSSNLDPSVQAEIGRVLAPGGTVYLLGGALALSPTIDTTLQGLGYKTVRLGGDNEFSTSVVIAQQMNNPSTVFEATGLNFADALSAVPAAIQKHGAILLTNGPVQSPETGAYLAAHPSDTRYAIGGPLAAAGADPNATAIFGNDLYDTSAAVASKFFPSPSAVGAATGNNFPDALSGGPILGLAKGPLLLVAPNGPLPASVAAYLSQVAAGIASGTLFGGPLAVTDQVLAELDGAA